MEEQRKDFIIGGLPLGSGDFVDKSKARENKNKLLAALDNINKVHEKKMSVDNPTVANAQNNDAVGITLDMLDKDNAAAITKPAVSKDEYIFENQIVRDSIIPEPNTQAQPASEPQGQPLFQFDTMQQPAFDTAAPMDIPSNEPIELTDQDRAQFEQQLVPDEAYAQSYPQEFNQGEPMLVLDDSQVGKKGKKGSSESKKKKTGGNSSPEQIKSGRFVAWMAYLIFFLPLLFNGRNSYVRHHANEGLELNIVDVIGIGLFLAAKYVKTTNMILSTALMIGNIIGLLLIMITTVTKVFLIIFALAGKEASTPFFGKSRMIK